MMFWEIEFRMNKSLLKVQKKQILWDYIAIPVEKENIALKILEVIKLIDAEQ
jgi:hypothetical protein